MDLRVFYQKIREVEESLSADSVVLVSLETPDGGKAGVRTEVPRSLAARMVVEGRARIASDEDAAEFREQTAEAKRTADQIAAASRMQVTVLPTADWRNMRGTGRGRD